jgi:type 1 glutamine amidotransferase
MLKHRSATRAAAACALTALLLVALMEVGATAQGPAGRGGRQGGSGRGGPFAGQPLINVLLVTGGCCHDYISQAKILVDAMAKSLPINWTIALPAANAAEGKVPLYNDPDWAKGFDLVVHNECYANQQQASFIQQITAGHKNGLPAVVIHCAMHSYRAATVDDWRELLGVTSRRHTAQHRIAVTWTQGDPIVAGLPAWTTPNDELYVIDKVWPGTTAVATAVSPEEGNPVFPVAWKHEYQGGARIFGTTIGHGMDTWNDPVFLDLVTRGFRWALKKDPVAPPTGH